MNEDLYSEETRKFMSEEKKASIKAEVFSWVKVIVSAIIIALLVDFFIIANAVVPTGSMETTIPAGSRIMGLRLYYDFKEPERGDIVIFKYPDDESVDYLKRIIGLPGETVITGLIRCRRTAISCWEIIGLFRRIPGTGTIPMLRRIRS